MLPTVERIRIVIHKEDCEGGNSVRFILTHRDSILFGDLNVGGGPVLPEIS